MSLGAFPLLLLDGLQMGQTIGLSILQKVLSVLSVIGRTTLLLTFGRHSMVDREIEGRRGSAGLGVRG